MGLSVPKKNNTKKKSRAAGLPEVVREQSLPHVRNVSIDAEKLTEIVKAVVLEFAEALPEPMTEEQVQRLRRNRGRGYAVRLRNRMKKYQAVYNAAWFIRHAESTERHYREQKMRAFWNVCVKEFEHCNDIEAFTYAVADALTSYRFGFPWEG